MTQPTDDPRAADEPLNPLPDVDTVIHDAREESWQLPDAQRPPAGGAGDEDGQAAATSPEVAYPAADAAHPAMAQGRSAATAHAAPAHGATTTAHGAHGEEDEQPLGPVDVELWGAGALATVIGLFMAICFVLATAGTGAY